MRRDLDLVRTILLQMERSPHGLCTENPVIDGYSDEEVGYHVHLMAQAGLIVAADCTALSDTSPQAIALSMTWAGHDFLDAAKDDNLWNKAKTMVIKPAGGAMFSVVLEWLKQQALEGLGLS